MPGLQWGVVKNMELWQDLLHGLGDDVVKVIKWHPKVNAESFKSQNLRVIESDPHRTLESLKSLLQEFNA